MRFILVLLLFNFISFNSKGQDRFITNADTINKSRVIGTSIGIGSVWTGSMIGLSQVWYSEITKTTFHTFDDSKNWLQMDKVGHFYAAYKINMLTTEAYIWSGIKKKKATLIGAGISIGYQTSFALFDAYSADWGFSWTDIIANTIGTASYSAQILAWNEERIIPKFSYHPTDYAAIRPKILGSTFTESLLKDYNGQTYWLSFSPATFFKSSKIPKWACVSIGYSVKEKIVGDAENFIDINGTEYNSQRQFLLSLDIDFSRLNIKKPWLRKIVKQLNYLKIPFPALIISNGEIIGNPLYF